MAQDFTKLLDVMERGPALAVARAMRQIEDQLLDALDELSLDGDLLVADAFNIQRADAMIDAIRANLGELGFDSVISEQLDGLKQMAREVQNQAADIGLPKAFSDVEQAQISSLFNRSAAKMNHLAQTVANDLDDLIHDSILGTADFRSVVKGLKRITGYRENQVNALASSTLLNFQRSTTIAKAQKADVEWFLYDGPADGSNRDFCAALVGHRVTIPQLESLAGAYGRNPALVPVAVWLGGYRCRHVLTPLVTKAAQDRYPIFGG